MIRAHSILCLCALLTSATAAPRVTAVSAVQEAETETVKGRVTNYVPGSGALIDRGSFDGLKTGDRVTFSVRGGDKFGKVVELQRRIALVKPETPTYQPKPGTKVRIEVPVSRFDEPPEATPPKEEKKPKAEDRKQAKGDEKPAKAKPSAKAGGAAGAATGGKAASKPKTQSPKSTAPKKDAPKNDAPKAATKPQRTPEKTTDKTGEKAAKPKAAKPGQATETAPSKKPKDEPNLPLEPKLQKSKIETVTARVTRFLDGTGIVIDRGTVDGLRAGDRVTFTARGGRTEFGTIVAVEGRVAIVRAQDPLFTPDPGTPATVDIDTSRHDEKIPVAPKPVFEIDDTFGSLPAESGEKPKTKWTNQDDDWEEGMPLLAQVEAVDPRDRASKLTGRVYFSYDQIFDTDDERSDTFARGGLALFNDNPFGHGGRLHFDGEVNYRQFDVPEDYGYGEDETNFRLDRLSYSIGGTRFTPQRWTFGRFIHNEMAEFGVIDGVEWSTRFSGGDRVGVSLGYLPEPDKDQQSFEDLSVNVWYRWVADLRELFSITAGFQKTWHNGNSDRDLFIGKFQYVPASGWSVFGNAWVDIYDTDDLNKDTGPELTYAIFDVRRALGRKSGISLEYRHQEYPELLRDEFRPVSPWQLADARVDRLGLSAWRWIEGTADRRGKRLYGRIGAWEDEEDSGADAELGIDVQGIFNENGRLDVAVFGADGKFSTHIGGRIRYGRYGPTSSWSLLAETRQNDITGFEVNNDDLIQYRFRWNYEFLKSSGFSANFFTDVLLQDIENQLFLGIFLQRAF